MDQIDLKANNILKPLFSRLNSSHLFRKVCENQIIILTLINFFELNEIIAFMETCKQSRKLSKCKKIQIHILKLKIKIMQQFQQKKKEQYFSFSIKKQEKQKLTRKINLNIGLNLSTFFKQANKKQQQATQSSKNEKVVVERKKDLHEIFRENYKKPEFEVIPDKKPRMVVFVEYLERKRDRINLIFNTDSQFKYIPMIARKFLLHQ